ncbi:F-box C protein [Caenorhabditis elegans]|uniref:F-box C protein n=1 Tax=Caenorhabditis elegans TaxID=6239 RepID=P91107_CAEEL|nr:F-box C protein [Caenorhabditis elegans]CCD66350.2 F-box C protein [Caenorhabditis elegans]|eukprot:NP_493863.2 F-box C protein [Caenorhabditis elegans]
MEKLKPLSYLSTKSIIQYFDPILRFHLSQQYPSLLSTERSVPLRLDSLKLGGNSDSVNSIRCELAVYRHGGRLSKKFKLDVTEDGKVDMNIVVVEGLGEILVDLRGNREINTADVMKIFGGRGLIIVGTLSIGCRGILRIPSRLKFEIRDLELGSEDNIKLFEEIKPLLHLTSFPLNYFSLFNSYNLRYEDPVVQSTGVLIFKNISSFDNNELENLNELRHKRAHLSFDRYFELQIIVGLIGNWIKFGRDIGTYYSVELQAKNKGSEVLEIIKRNHEERIIDRPNEDPNIVLLRMNNLLALYISYEFYEKYCLMHFRVQPRY